jgi:hypothetical protein
MEPSAVIELVAGEVDQMDAVFEFWLAGTFAVIVAIHAVRESLNPRLKLLMAGLYATLTLIALLHTIGDSLQITYLNSFLQESANEYVGAGGFAGALAMLLRYALFTVGALCVVVFIFRYDRWLDQTDRPDQSQ